MEPRFTRGEYWLLETAVEDQWPVRLLIDSDLELHVNKTGHGLTREALIETLHRLIASGLIFAQNEVDPPISTPQQIERALDETHWRFATGGEREKKHVLWADTGRGRTMGGVRRTRLAKIHTHESSFK